MGDSIAKGKTRILIADDSSSLRNRLGQMVSKIPGVGLVRLAGDVAGALAAVRDEPVDLAVLDVQMPGGSGIDVLRELKQSSPATIAIMFTNYPYRQYQEKCLELGADYFLSKSTNSSVLLDMIERLARRKENLGGEQRNQ